MGKAYANKKATTSQPEGNFYPTPKSLIWVAKDIILEEFSRDKIILEPCYGEGSISNELEKIGFSIEKHDLFKDGIDYLQLETSLEQVITNPPFNLWDEFLTKAKTHASKIMLIGRLNYLSTKGRLSEGLWDNLKSIYCFNRYVDYRTPLREDGLFNVGAMATGWFVWDMSYTGEPQIRFLDVDNYAKLGNYKENDKKC